MPLIDMLRARGGVRHEDEDTSRARKRRSGREYEHVVWTETLGVWRRRVWDSSVCVAAKRRVVFILPDARVGPGSA
eukprot:2915230-Rhodomonas_salina.4